MRITSPSIPDLTPFPRVILIVLDSVGCGELADAAAYGDEGSDTLGNIARQIPLSVPTLRALGLDRVVNIGEPPAAPPRHANLPRGTRPRDDEGRASARTTRPASDDEGLVAPGGARPATVDVGRMPRPSPSFKVSPALAEGRSGPGAAFGRMAERSAGKDSVTGHWEMMGIVLDKPFPTFPSGFPREVIDEFERRIGRATIGNVVASGTEIIDRLGAEHVATGRPIVYTSADSVFQVAAHEDVIPIQEQYRICEAAFDIVGRGMGVGRVIARPFTGRPGSFKRTTNRHDYALDPTGETLLDLLSKRGAPVVSVGKVSDLFAGRGITRSLPTVSDRNGVERILEAMGDTPAGLIFANLVDFDAQFGHRNDVQGYAANLEQVDGCLATVLRRLRSTDLLIITADHGNDPTTPSTDHSREHVPLLLTGDGVRPGVDLGTRTTFSDLGQTLAANFDVGALKHGTSFLGDILVEHS